MSNVHKFEPRKPADKPAQRSPGQRDRQASSRPAGPQTGRPDPARRNAAAVMIGIGLLIGVSMLVAQIGI